MLAHRLPPHGTRSPMQAKFGLLIRDAIATFRSSTTIVCYARVCVRVVRCRSAVLVLFILVLVAEGLYRSFCTFCCLARANVLPSFFFFFFFVNCVQSFVPCYCFCHAHTHTHRSPFIVFPRCFAYSRPTHAICERPAWKQSVACVDQRSNWRSCAQRQHCRVGWRCVLFVCIKIYTCVLTAQ